ncbi:DNA excision repair protein ERCC-4 [[Emmonsia] crescens]|uniref:DNA excision repair protein ERCC-4 n=1 Tax=[Emmonsia] crescens TaxID=73230 RepID=A0A0G2J988_9EURO|nr:DNA excision repair protein ERCC-4 [Emmonsia crescens UAMH 3008]
MSVEQMNPVVKLSLPLQYQQDLFSELRSEDELVILARGLGLLRIVTNLLHSYDAAGNNLIIVVGAGSRENEWIGEELLDPEIITGVIVLHAEKIVATSLEAFIIRIYRQFNKVGFLKAFSDSPEPFTTGFNPLSNMMRNLFLRKPSLWPRFQVTVAESLEGRKKAEVIELEVPMTDKMRHIQNAVLECVEANIRELKKANSGLDIEDWTVDSALHQDFDMGIRRQLEHMWHRVTFRTKQIASDLTVLRSILHSLLTYDSVSFIKYLDTIIAAHSPPPGSTRQNYSPWLFLDAAHVLFQTAKSRVYRGKIENREFISGTASLPTALEPVLEEQPKWAVLADVLDEIERSTYLNPVLPGDSNGTILVMCSDRKTCYQIREYLETMRIKVETSTDMETGVEADDIPSGEFMLRRKLRHYLNWKRDSSRVNSNLYGTTSKQEPGTTPGYNSVSSATSYQGRAPPQKRRRVRGGGGSGLAPERGASGSVQPDTGMPAQVSTLLEGIKLAEPEEETIEIGVVDDDLKDMEDYYQLYDMNDLLMVYPYDGDMDDHVLEEVKPRYIIMYEPDAAFIRRVEVYRSSHTDREVRVYFLYYGGSVEEQRYLSAVRREKDAFTKLIKEKGSMALTITHDKSAEDPQEQFLRTVNTRIAGGGRLAATAAPPTVVVDVREFRSALPSLLHGRSMVVVPCQLTVGDYILTPDICVERKSIRDLFSSLKNGRLYNQAETMLQHYKTPVLLIEFDQNKSFTFDAFTSAANTPGSESLSSNLINPTNPKSIQHLLTLLTLAFPRLKIVWSSAPYQTAEIFAELKKNSAEPDPIRAVQIGLDFDITSSTTAAAASAAGTSNSVMSAAGIEHRTFNQLPQDMLRAVPGVTPKIAERLILETENLQQIANMEMEELEPLVGKEVGRQILRFFRRNVFDEEGAD